MTEFQTIMDCIFCQQTIHSTDPIFICKNHSNWDVKYNFYDSRNSSIYSKPTLHTIVFLSTNDEYGIILDMIKLTTSFIKFPINDRPYYKVYDLATFPELKCVTPENADQWIQRINNLTAFS